MRRRITIIITLFVVSIILLLSFWCTLFPGSPACAPPLLIPTMQGSASAGTAYLWLTPYKDAYVKCSGTTTCPDGSQNFGTLFNLDVARGSVALREERTYVQFYIPELPVGVQVLEAYINVFEDSRQQPGTATIPVALASGTWLAREITWNTQPGPASSGATIGVSIGPFQNVNEWRGHNPGMPLAIVQNILDNPDDDNGFILNNGSPPPFLRSFSSDNHLSRTETVLGNAPRLLLKVQTEIDLNPGTITLPPIPADTDLDEFLSPGSVLMLIVAPGPNWPVAWNLAVN